MDNSKKSTQVSGRHQMLAVDVIYQAMDEVPVTFDIYKLLWLWQCITRRMLSILVDVKQNKYKGVNPPLLNLIRKEVTWLKL